MGTVFTAPQSIETAAQKIFTGLQKENCYIGYDCERFIESIVDYLRDLFNESIT